VRVCDADDLHALVTDANRDEPALRGLARAGVQVVHA
jgi:hypothetical protein